MPHIHESIPAHVAQEAEAARAWFSRAEGSEFKLTGIVEPAESSPSTTRDLQLILCGEREGQEVCLRERFAVSSFTDGFEVTHVANETPEIGSAAPLLDPPVGVRANWLAKILPKHDFTVLLFYRGFW